MKILTVLLLAAISFTAAACESTSTESKKQADDSHFIGDTRVKVSGEIQAGGTVDTRK